MIENRNPQSRGRGAMGGGCVVRRSRLHLRVRGYPEAAFRSFHQWKMEGFALSLEGRCPANDRDLTGMMQAGDFPRQSTEITPDGRASFSE